MYIGLALQIKKLLDTMCPGALHTAQFSADCIAIMTCHRC